MKTLWRNYRSRSGNRSPATVPIASFKVRKRTLNLRQRRQLRKLLAFDDRTLDDMGYDRETIRRDLRMPAKSRKAAIINNIHQQDMHPTGSRLHH